MIETLIAVMTLAGGVAAFISGSILVLKGMIENALQSAYVRRDYYLHATARANKILLGWMASTIELSAAA